MVRGVDQLNSSVRGPKAESFPGNVGTSGQDAITCKESESCLKGTWQLSGGGFLEVVTRFMKSGQMVGHISILRRKWRARLRQSTAFLLRKAVCLLRAVFRERTVGANTAHVF